MNILTNPDSAAGRLVEVAHQSEHIAAVIQVDEAAWTLAFEDDTAFLVEWADEPGRLVVSVDIGKPPVKREIEVRATALSYNTLWRETGSVRISMSGEEGELLLIRALPTAIVQGDEFAAILEHFALIARWWTAYVTSEDFGDAPVTPPGMAELMNRV